jgi:TRAP-type C4-dicarboxylate transport system permease small subunit
VLCILVVFLGLAGTHVVGGHVRVELLLQALPKRLQSLLTDFLVPLVSILFLGLLGWSGWVATAQMFALGTTTPSRPAILLWPIAAVVPAGCVLLILLLVLNLVRRFRSRN